MIGLDSYSRQVYLFGPNFDLYQSLNRLPIWNSQNCSMFPLAFVAVWLQGHWWGFISRNYVVWPTFFLMNIFIALKGSHFWFYIRATTARTRHVNAYGRRQYLPDVMDYLAIQSITVCGKVTTSSVRTALKRSDNDETSQAWLCAISSCGVSTGTGFRSVAKSDLPSAMLVVKCTNKRCWDCYMLERDRFGEGSFVVWGGKMGDQKAYFVVMQYNFNGLYRRRLGSSCHTISPLFLHIKNWSDIWNRLKQNKKANECNVFFVLSFLKGVGILSWKEINAMWR